MLLIGIDIGTTNIKGSLFNPNGTRVSSVSRPTRTHYHGTAIADHPPEEIWQDPQPGLDLENYYFEKTPVEWVDGFITETEVLKPTQLESLKKQVNKS